jgi:hypothetical protein
MGHRRVVPSISPNTIGLGAQHQARQPAAMGTLWSIAFWHESPRSACGLRRATELSIGSTNV